MIIQASGEMSQGPTEDTHGQGDAEGEEYEVSEPEHRGTRRGGQHREHRRRTR